MAQKIDESKNVVQLPPELDDRLTEYLATDSFGYESKDEFARDAIRRHLELMIEVNKIC